MELYAEAERRILADMARRINAYDFFIPAAEHQLRVLEEMGAARAYILKELAAMTNRTERELVRLMEEAGIEGISDDDAVYRAAGLKPQPLTASRLLQERLAAGYRQTQGLFKNLTRTTAKAGSRQLVQALDNAWMMASSGAFSCEEAMRTAIKQLAADGVTAVEYTGGRRLSIEAAVRLCVSTGTNQTVAKMQETRADEMGCDLVEVTAHAGARPEHAEWQGGIYSRSGKSKKYPDLRRATGYGTAVGLCGCNCRHSFHPYIEGSPRAYNSELLAAYDSKTREYNGKKLTEYEARQQQRKIERNIRRWKREYVAMQAAGLNTGESAGKLKHWQTVQKDFLSQTGLKRQIGREQVATFGKSEAARAGIEVRAEKRYNKFRQEVHEIIRKDYPLIVNAAKQNKHIRGTSNFDPTRSELTADPEELIKLYAGKSEPVMPKSGKWNQKERFVHTSIIGIWRDLAGNEVLTSRGMIHYSPKKGLHIVPSEPVQEENDD